MPELNPITYNFLSAAELADLFSQPGMKYFKKEAVKRQAKGCLCFALKHHHDCAAYMWCNLRECNSDLVPFPLNSGEAYLLGARTMDAYRGKNLAPFIRYELYKKLVKMGYTRFYSTTEYFNASAVNFKRKLKARHIKLCLYFGLFNKPIFNLALRKYSLTYK
ncbi:MAG: hypothetical protein JW967_03730 [Dehalococcoidales bacterium]|nr:hypothetical protein [Dehalococcoidales bacterium]